jgi:broad specificity phosphatase PhoE
MLTIVFWAHGSTYDNDAGVASGHNDVDLSPLGIEQATAMGERYRDEHFAAVFSSDLRRAHTTAELAFGGRAIPLLTDPRLRECNYGDLDGHPRDEVDAIRRTRLYEPFPGGESYTQVVERVRTFLTDALRAYDGKRLMLIGHSGTLWALLVCVKGVPLEEAVGTPVVPLLGSVYEVAL